MTAELPSNFIREHTCFACGEFFAFREERRFVNAVKVERNLGLKIETVDRGYGPQRICLNPVPIELVKIICLPCWQQHRNGELEKYALAIVHAHPAL